MESTTHISISDTDARSFGLKGSSHQFRSQQAIGHISQAASEPFEAMSAHVNRIIQFKVDRRNHGSMGLEGRPGTLGLPYTIPIFGIRVMRHQATNLHIVKRQVRLPKVTT